MNGDWIVLDIEPDVCCELNGDGCTCKLEEAHLKELRKCNFELYNVGCSVDEIEEEIVSKVGIPGDPATHYFATTKTGDNQYLHSLE
jgi:hypothetical protein